MIDPGADITAIHPQVILPLSPVASRSVNLYRPGMVGVHPAPLHDVRLVFADARPGAKWIAITAVGVVPATPGVLAIIGRDLLAHCRFLDDGPKAEVLLSYR